MKKINIVIFLILYTYCAYAQSSSVSGRKSLSDTSIKPRTYQTVQPVSDVDENIPQIIGKGINNNLFVVAIGNETYSDKSISSVKYASNDVSIFADYCQQALGVPKQNIHKLENATHNQIKYELNWLNQVASAYGGDAKFIFYYAGHGIPDEVSKVSYLLPADCYINDLSTAYPLVELYDKLGKLETSNVIVFLDACFSGMSRSGTFLSSSRGVVIKPKTYIPQNESLFVLSATQDEETAYPYEEQQHGLFTYFLLKKLQTSPHSLTLTELSDYVVENVKRASVVINGKPQTPTIFTINKQLWNDYRIK